MTPRRWVFVSAGVGLAYTTLLVYASISGGPVLPDELNEAILALLVTGFVLAGSASLAERTGKRIVENIRSNPQDLDGYARGYADGLARKELPPQRLTAVGK